MKLKLHQELPPQNILDNFKRKIIKELKSLFKPGDSDTIRNIIDNFPDVILDIEYTNINVDYSWDTYIAILHLYVKKKYVELYKQNSELIFNIANNIYINEYDLIFKDDVPYMLQKIVITELTTVENSEDVAEDFLKKAKSDTLKLAIADANNFITNGNYTSALDRIHTFFMGYVRENLQKKGIEYTESETLNQLFKKMYTFYESNASLDKKITTILKSLTGAVYSINELRNKNSLSHPNENIVNDRDAKLAIEAVRIIVNYLEEL